MKIHLIAPAKEHVRVTREEDRPINSKMFRFSLLSLLSVGEAEGTWARGAVKNYTDHKTVERVTATNGGANEKFQPKN